MTKEIIRVTEDRHEELLSAKCALMGQGGKATVRHDFDTNECALIWSDGRWSSHMLK